MARYHVKSDGAMGVCKAQEGHCPFASDAGVKHFTSESLARLYAEYVIKNTNNGGMKKMKKTSSPKVWPTTEHGCHMATYSGWDGPDTIISAGGYVNGVYVPASEVWEVAGLYDQLSPEVQAEMPMADGYPGEWNDKILELEKSGELSDEDEEILDAIWVSGEVCEGSVTIYGRDDSVTRLDESNLYEMGLERAVDDDDDEDDDEDESPTTSPTTDNNEPTMTTNKWGLNVTTWPPEEGVHSASYLGWGGDDDYEIIHDGGYVDGKYIPSHEAYGLLDKLSPGVRDEMDSLDGQGTGGATPAEWNGKILELEKKGVSPEDEELLDALWIGAESFEGSVTIYGPDATVSEMDEDDLERYGLRRMTADELWHYGVIVDDDDDDATEDE